MESWKEVLVSQAKEKHMCGENFRMLIECDDKESAIYLYKKTIDWALEERYPTESVLREYFSDCEEYGIFVGKTLDKIEMSKKQVYVLHGCNGFIRVAMDYEKAVIPMIYVANGCDITIECVQHNSIPIVVPIYIFGDNKVKTIGNKNAIFNTYRMSVK